MRPPAIASALADDAQERQEWVGAHRNDTSRPLSESVRAAKELRRLAQQHAGDEQRHGA
jgi:hypothetical protein